MRSTSGVVPVLLVASLAACASAERRGSVGGVFDQGGADEEGGGVSGDDARVGRSAPMRPTAESAPTAIDFGGDVIEGAFDAFAPDPAAVAAKPSSAPSPPSPPPPPSPPQPGEPTRPPPESSATVRLVIYKGSLVILVPALDAAVEKLAARVQEAGGYVEQQSGNSSANQATVTLRVPAEKFYALVNDLGGYGQVMQKDISATDVTKQVFDVELRLETAERSRQRLLDLLKTATKMDEILQIEGQVRRLTEEIEQMKGQLRFLRDQVAMSTLAVTFYSSAPPPTAGPPRTRSRFEWVNKVGIERVVAEF